MGEREEERAAIVAWLQSRSDAFFDESSRLPHKQHAQALLRTRALTLGLAASEIERGEHLSAEYRQREMEARR